MTEELFVIVSSTECRKISEDEFRARNILNIITDNSRETFKIHGDCFSYKNKRGISLKEGFYFSATYAGIIVNGKVVLFRNIVRTLSVKR